MDADDWTIPHLWKERDELKHDIARHVAICTEYLAEIERLREALRAIADLPYDAIHRNQDPRLIASRALEGKQ